MATLTVTTKGQITLKPELLRHLSVSPGRKVEVEKLPGGRLLIAPAHQYPRRSVKDFSGSLAQKNGIKLTIEQIKEITEMCWAGEFEKINAIVPGRKS